MRFVITGGGTAGHINPALAVAAELKTAGHEVCYAGKPESLEARLVPEQGFEFVEFETAGFNRRKPWTFVTSSCKIAASSRKARKWLKVYQPDAVVGFGGYVSIPVGLAASQENIPLIVHEQNSTSGMANRFLAKRAQLVALSYAAAADDFKTGGKIIVTGNPVRASLQDIDPRTARRFFGIPDAATVLLVFGGSLGAKHINERLIAHADRLMAIEGLYVLHITGVRDYDDSVEALADCAATVGRWKLIEYCDDMGEAFAASDVVLSRSGATTLAELGALGKPALLVPYPHAAADEQTKNAKDLVDIGAADMIADCELDEPVFMEKLLTLIKDTDYRERMLRSALGSRRSQARRELAQHIITLAEGRR